VCIFLTKYLGISSLTWVFCDSEFLLHNALRRPDDYVCSLGFKSSILRIVSDTLISD